LADAAYYGWLGEFVKKVSPTNEGDPPAILITALTAVGSLMGRAWFFEVDDKRHYPVLYSVFVGDTGISRKSAPVAVVKKQTEIVDQEWTERSYKVGLRTAEGLVNMLRDPPPRTR
jgi:hypothetical protein